MIDLPLGRTKEKFWFLAQDSYNAGYYTQKHYAPPGTLVYLDIMDGSAYLAEGDLAGWIGPGLRESDVTPLSPLELLAREA